MCESLRRFVWRFITALVGQCLRGTAVSSHPTQINWESVPKVLFYCFGVGALILNLLCLPTTLPIVFGTATATAVTHEMLTIKGVMDLLTFIFAYIYMSFPIRRACAEACRPRDDEFQETIPPEPSGDIYYAEDIPLRVLRTQIMPVLREYERYIDNQASQEADIFAPGPSGVHTQVKTANVQNDESSTESPDNETLERQVETAEGSGILSGELLEPETTRARKQFAYKQLHQQPEDSAICETSFTIEASSEQAGPSTKPDSTASTSKKRKQYPTAIKQPKIKLLSGAADEPTDAKESESLLEELDSTDEDEGASKPTGASLLEAAPSPPKNPALRKLFTTISHDFERFKSPGINLSQLRAALKGMLSPYPKPDKEKVFSLFKRESKKMKETEETLRELSAVELHRSWQTLIGAEAPSGIQETAIAEADIEPQSHVASATAEVELPEQTSDSVGSDSGRIECAEVDDQGKEITPQVTSTAIELKEPSPGSPTPEEPSGDEESVAAAALTEVESHTHEEKMDET